MAQGSKTNAYTRTINGSFIPLNEEGERNVSTSHIAARLGISPGNLCYHLRSKDEIIVQLFKCYSEALLEYLNNTTLPFSAEDSINHVADIYDVMWEYRFLFSGVNTLPMRSSELLGEHNNFIQAKVLLLLVNLLSQFDGLSIIHADQTAMNDLIANMWMITKYWLDFDDSLRGRAKLIKDSKARGIRRTLSLLRSYLLPQYIEEFDHKISIAADIGDSQAVDIFQTVSKPDLVKQYDNTRPQPLDHLKKDST